MEHATNYNGTRVEHVWNMCGTWAEHDAGRRSARIDALEAPRGLAIWLWRLPHAERRALEQRRFMQAIRRAFARVANLRWRWPWGQDAVVCGKMKM